MQEQEIYQKIGELLWLIMPQEATVIYFTGTIYPEHQSWITNFTLKNSNQYTFDLGQEPTNIEMKIKDLVNDLKELDTFAEKWTHYKITLTEEGKINFDFAYILEEDSWVSLLMRGISDLSEDELNRDYSQIPRELWEERVKLKAKNTNL